MRKMKKLVWGSLGALMAIAVLTSCEDDYEAPAFDALGDVFVQKIKEGDVNKYAPVFYAYGNYDMAKVTVKTPGENGQTYDLAKYFDNRRVFRLVPQGLDFSETMPIDGEYTFTIISSQNDTIIRKDLLQEKEIDALSISEFSYTQETHVFDIEWNDIEDADIYVVKLIDEKTDKVLYSSNSLTNHHHTFRPLSSGWLYGVQMEEGETYSVKVYAYQFENSAVQSGYDLQMECIDSREIIW